MCIDVALRSSLGVRRLDQTTLSRSEQVGAGGGDSHSDSHQSVIPISP